MKARVRRASRNDKYNSLALNHSIRWLFDLKDGRTYNWFLQEPGDDGRTYIAAGQVKPGNNRVYLNGADVHNGHHLNHPDIQVGSPMDLEIVGLQWVRGT